MAWTKSTTNTGLVYQTELGIVLPSSATTAYSSEINFLRFDNTKDSVNATIFITVDAVTGTNIDIALYGAYQSGGTKYLLLDALVADITGAENVAASIDINDYPAPFYYIAWTTDVDESTNTIGLAITY